MMQGQVSAISSNVISKLQRFNHMVYESVTTWVAEQDGSHLQFNGLAF